jgi:hypothetical protein
MKNKVNEQHFLQPVIERKTQTQVRKEMQQKDNKT